MDPRGKVAIVTGGASGLGEATVDRLVAMGAKVAAFDLNVELGAKLHERHDRNVMHFAVDVASEDQVSSAIAEAVTQMGPIYMTVNCAGVPGKPGRIVGKTGPLPLHEFEKTLRVNLVGTFNVCRLTAAQMVRNTPLSETGERGVIVNVSSLAGIEGQMGQICYAASKAGVIGMMLPLVRDLSQFNIRTCTIAPGLFETPMGSGTPDEIKAKLVSQLEFPKRMGKPSEFAALVTHIVENQYLNGELIRIDAGTRAPPR
jgi:NAD(P)-dependent dehydrogenase (short-subunit alcohol dehydrogenase family)